MHWNVGRVGIKKESFLIGRLYNGIFVLWEKSLFRGIILWITFEVIHNRKSYNKMRRVFNYRVRILIPSFLL